MVSRNSKAAHLSCRQHKTTDIFLSPRSTGLSISLHPGIQCVEDVLKIHVRRLVFCRSFVVCFVCYDCAASTVGELNMCTELG